MSLRHLVLAERDRPHNVRAVFVGEVNPYGPRDGFALYPDPPNCAGWRLCHRVLNLTDAEYLHHYARGNLCTGKWTAEAARVAADVLQRQWVGFDEQRTAAGSLLHPWGTPFVLLGRKVAAAFGCAAQPFTSARCPTHGRLLISLPHPSGLCRVWATRPGAYDSARALLRGFGLLPTVAASGPALSPTVRCANCGEFTDSGRADACQHCGRTA